MTAPTYRATCTECDTWTTPLSYVEAVGWTVEHANACPDARTEIHERGLDMWAPDGS